LFNLEFHDPPCENAICLEAITKIRHNVKSINNELISTWITISDFDQCKIFTNSLLDIFIPKIFVLQQKRH
jgi:hypothetical protein